MRTPVLLLIAVVGVSCAPDAAANPLAGALSLFGLGGNKQAKQEKKEVMDDTKRTLQERLSRPNLEKSFDATKGSPVANRSLGSKKASTKEFSTRAFSAREFSSRDYAGTKGAYLGKGKVTTPEAPTKGRNVIPNLGDRTPTKTVAVKIPWDADKEVDTRTASAAGREFLVRGRSQDQLDIERNVPRSSKPLGYTGDLKKLTIDDIRELLNKNK